MNTVIGMSGMTSQFGSPASLAGVSPLHSSLPPFLLSLTPSVVL